MEASPRVLAFDPFRQSFTIPRLIDPASMLSGESLCFETRLKRLAGLVERLEPDQFTAIELLVEAYLENEQ